MPIIMRKQSERKNEMRQTVKQFIASIKKSNSPKDMDYQVNAWPYPQAEQSHIAIYRKSWKRVSDKLPERQIRIKLVNSDCVGVLMRVSPDAPSPAKVASMLNEA